ncbi:MAG: phasin family protein [Burkholderiales bacterium]|nr:MAG: phasin family protein [Burkholderiales bacterium]
MEPRGETAPNGAGFPRIETAVSMGVEIMLKQAKAKLGAKQVEQVKDLSKLVLDSSHQIWLAGLGAFARAQQEGSKVFELLVKQGQEIESRTKDIASAKVEEVRARTEEIKAKATGNWDKLEHVFEERVSRALNRLGVYTSKDVQALADRVADLSEAVNTLLAEKQGTKPAKATAPKATAAKAAAPKATKPRATKAARSATH